MRARLAGLLLLAACGRPRAPDAAVTTRPSDAAPAATAPPPDAAPRGASDVAVRINDGEAIALRWGFATYGFHGPLVTLTSEPVRCTTADTLGLPSDASGVRLRFEVPAGPGGTFYAGHPIGVSVIAESSAHRVELPGLAGMPLTLMISPPAVALTLEPFAVAEGAHLRGTIEGAEASLLGAIDARGAFDVELCVKPLEGWATPLRAEAPATPALGTRGSRKLAPRTVHAIVQRRGATYDEAIDVTIGRAAGSLEELTALFFYDREDVPCPTADQVFDGNGAILTLRSIGGTSRAKPLTGAQPADAVLPGPDNAFGAVWSAWVQLDELAFEPGAKLRGRLWAESDPDAEEKGSFGGTFEATVCVP